MKLSDNIWWTRKARIQTEKRLLSNAKHAELLLLWYSFSGVAVSIYYLLCPSQMSPEHTSAIWITFSVLVLAMSGFINGQSYKERAGLIKECYESLHKTYHKALSDSSDLNLISSEYNQILNICENHTDIDDYKALFITHHTNNSELDPNTGIKKNLNRAPTNYHLFILGSYFLIRNLALFALYALPVIIFFTIL